MDEADCSMVHQVEQRCFNDPWTLESIVESLNNKNCHYFVAVQDEVVVGFIGLLLVAGECEIINVAVLPESSNQGIGKELMQASLLFLQEKSTEKVYLEVRESNQKALALYGYYDFQPIGIRRQYYGNPIEDAIVMCLELRESYKVFPL